MWLSFLLVCFTAPAWKWYVIPTEIELESEHKEEMMRRMRESVVRHANVKKRKSSRGDRSGETAGLTTEDHQVCCLTTDVAAAESLDTAVVVPGVPVGPVGPVGPVAGTSPHRGRVGPRHTGATGATGMGSEAGSPDSRVDGEPPVRQSAFRPEDGRALEAAYLQHVLEDAGSERVANA